jgi:hypothetical protein
MGHTACTDLQSLYKGALYRIHLKAAQEWGNTWYTILDSIDVSINQELELLYQENICYGRTITNTTTKNCTTGGIRN